MKKKLIIVGLGAQSKYAEEICALRGIRLLGLVALPQEDEDRDDLVGPLLGGLDRIDEIYEKNGRPGIAICASRNKTKQEVASSLARLDPDYPALIHPQACIARTAEVGPGTIINPLAVLQPLARVGAHCMIHAGAIVEHQALIEDFVNLAPRATILGHVKVKTGAHVYSGAVILPTLTVGKDAVVGAGAVLTANAPDRSRLVGVPARPAVKGKG